MKETINDKLEVLASLSCYRELVALDKKHDKFLVENLADKKIYVKKILHSYCLDIYISLKENHIVGIPKIYEIIKTSENSFVVIEEYINGTLLSDILSENQLSEKEICELFTKVCVIVNQLHKLTPPIIHRDIKSSNIIITKMGEPILIDFDISKLDDDLNIKKAIKSYTDSKETDTYLLGSKGYAAPEQYGFGISTKKTDIYALGILLNTMLKQGKVSRIPADNPKLKPIIEKCINLNPDERYEDIDELIFAVKNFKNDKIDTFKFPNIRNIPGFRKGIPWHMFVSTVYYILIFTLLLFFLNDIKKDSYNTYDMIGEMIIIIILFLISVLYIFNYRNIWKYIPFSNHKKFYIRMLFILLAYLLLSFTIIFIYIFYGSMFLHK